MKVFAPKSDTTVCDAFTEMVVKSPESVIYALVGIKVAVIGHTIDGYDNYLFVKITTA